MNEDREIVATVKEGLKRKKVTVRADWRSNRSISVCDEFKAQIQDPILRAIVIVIFIIKRNKLSPLKPFADEMEITPARTATVKDVRKSMTDTRLII